MYQVYKKGQGASSFTYFGWTTGTSMTDYSERVTDPGVEIEYRVRVKDTQNKYSVFSDPASIRVMPLKDNLSKKDFIVPGKYELKQNYPNPFNPTTSITFDLPEDSDVSIVVYNTLGKEVAVIANGFKTAGKYTATFDASELSSGVYLARMQAGDYVNTIRMLLVK